MTIREKIQADLDAAKVEVETAQAKVSQLEQTLANLPAEIETVAVEAWDTVKNFFKNFV